MEGTGMHSRQMALPGWGKTGQDKLARQQVLIVGVGGLGTQLALQLAASGVRKIYLLDFDQVDSSNLSRQILYCHHDVGRAKAEVAATFLSHRYPDTEFAARQGKFEEKDFDNFQGIDFFFDCTDDLPSRYVMEQFSKQYHKPWISGSLHRFQGQVALFHWEYAQGQRTINYSDLFKENSEKSNAGNCAEAGIAPYFPGLVAQLMAGEYFKAVIGYHQPLVNELLLLDALQLELTKIAVR